jgi:hypothetical protein
LLLPRGGAEVFQQRLLILADTFTPDTEKTTYFSGFSNAIGNFGHKVLLSLAIFIAGLLLEHIQC